MTKLFQMLLIQALSRMKRIFCGLLILMNGMKIHRGQWVQQLGLGMKFHIGYVLLGKINRSIGILL